VSSNPVKDEVSSIQQYVIKFVSHLRQVGGFLRVLRCPPPIKHELSWLDTGTSMNSGRDKVSFMGLLLKWWGDECVSYE